MYQEWRIDAVVQLIVASLESPAVPHWERGDRARRGCRGTPVNRHSRMNDGLFLPAQQPNHDVPHPLRSPAPPASAALPNPDQIIMVEEFQSSILDQRQLLSLSFRNSSEPVIASNYLGDDICVVGIKEQMESVF